MSNTVSKDDCWLYAKLKNSRDYGYFIVQKDGKRHLVSVHRLMYENVNGPIPEGLEVDHLCRVPNCINPEHLEAVTKKVNMQRMLGIEDGYCKRGHKLTSDNTQTWKNKNTGALHRKCKKCFNDYHRLRYQQLKDQQQAVNTTSAVEEDK